VAPPSHAWNALPAHAYHLRSDENGVDAPFGGIAEYAESPIVTRRDAWSDCAVSAVAQTGNMLVRRLGLALLSGAQLCFEPLPPRRMRGDGCAVASLTLSFLHFSTRGIL